MEKQKVKNKDFRLGRRIQRLRKKAGFTQEKLAENAGLSVTFIGLLESGLRKPSLKTLQKIANVIGVKARDLLPF